MPLIFFAVDVTWEYSVWRLYSLLLDPLLLKYNPVVTPILVANPIKSLDLLITYTYPWLPLKGKLNTLLVDVIPTVNELPPAGTVNNIFSLFLNGWFGI